MVEQHCHEAFDLQDCSDQLHNDEHSNYNCCSILVVMQETFDSLSEAELPDTVFLHVCTAGQ